MHWALSYFGGKLLCKAFKFWREILMRWILTILAGNPSAIDYNVASWIDKLHFQKLDVTLNL